MTKIDEIIQEHVDPHIFKTKGYEGLVDAMKEYAEHYAIKCLEIAANNATARIQNWDDPVVNTRSILNIKLPEHV